VKQLEEVKVVIHAVQSQKEEVEESFNEFKTNAEMNMMSSSMAFQQTPEPHLRRWKLRQRLIIWRHRSLLPVRRTTNWSLVWRD
jgi:hypothetical protein